MPRHHAVDERPERLVLEQLHGARDDARVDRAAEDDGAGVENQVEDEGAAVDDGGVMGWGVEGVFVFGEDVARVERVLWDWYAGDADGADRRVRRGASGFDGFEGKLEEQLCCRLWSRWRDLGSSFS